MIDTELAGLLWNFPSIDADTIMSSEVQCALLQPGVSGLLAQCVARSRHLTEEAVELALQHPTQLVTGAIEANPVLTVDRIRVLAEDLEAHRFVLENPNLPVDVQRSVILNGSDRSVLYLSYNPNLDATVQQLYWDDVATRYHLVDQEGLKRLKLHPSIVQDVVASGSKHERALLAENPYVDVEVLVELTYTTMAVLRNPRLPLEYVNRALALSHGLPDVAAHPNLPLRDQEELLAAGSMLVLESLARFSQEQLILDRLLRVGGVEVELAQNPVATHELLEVIVNGPDEQASLQAWLHPNYPRGLRSPARHAGRVAPWILDLVAGDAGVEAETLHALAKGWRRSIGELVEAAVLTSR